MGRSSPKLVLLRSPGRPGAGPGGGGLMGLEEALGAHLDALFRTARLLTGDEAAAEDLVQEAGLRACRGWDGLRSIPSVKAWLMQILHRTFLNSRRSEGRGPKLVDLDLDDLLSQPVVEPDLEKGLDAAAIAEEVARALDELPAGFREALWLVDVEELTLAEAAEVLELPLGTVASRAHRARRLLRDQLGRSRKGPFGD
ncbi:MAG: RNA polymerase sigma factor [Myxococcales bacterium]|nr:RNA polymerase sigma factor [Myxococcales bacterium]